MNFYLDFEASKKNEEIISIGCVAENGTSFSRYVIPSDLSDISDYIVKLTGITPDLIKEKGVYPDQAFAEFKDFVKASADGQVPTYFCYGDHDGTYIRKTMKNMSNFDAITFAGSICGTLCDYSKNVKKFLATNCVALKKIVALIRNVDEVEQRHDALEDAYMLKECYEGLDTLTPHVTKQNEEDEKIAEELKVLRASWSNYSRDTCMGDATAENYTVKITHNETGIVKYFSSDYALAVYFNMFIRQHKSAKKMNEIRKTIKDFQHQPANFCKYKIEEKED